MNWPFWLNERDREILTVAVNLSLYGNDPGQTHHQARNLARALGFNQLNDRGNVAQIGDAFMRNIREHQQGTKGKDSDATKQS